MRILKVFRVVNSGVCGIADKVIGIYRLIEDMDAMAMHSLAMLFRGPWSD